VVRLLVRGAPFALLVTALAVATAVWVTRTSDPVYRASVALVAARSAPRTADLDVVVPPVVDSGVYRSAIYEGEVLRRALEDLEGRALTERELAAFAEVVRVTLENQDLSSLVRIDVRDGSPERAARLANRIAEELVIWDRERARRALDQAVASLETAVAAVDRQLAAGADEVSDERRAVLSELRSERAAELERARDARATATAVGLIEMLGPARPPEEAVGPRLVLNTAIALLLGLVAGYGAVLVRWTARPRAFDEDDVVRATDRPVLARFPRPRRGDDRLSAEAMGWLRARLDAAMQDGPRMLMVTGASFSDEASAVAVGLAEAYARGGASVLLVDADLRAARATELLGAAPARSTPYDDEERSPPRGGAIRIAVARGNGYAFLPARPFTGHPVERVARAFGAFANEWTDEFDVVVVATPAALAHPDALVVAEHASHALLCARVGRAGMGELSEAVALLEEQGTDVKGTVLMRAGGRAERPASATPAEGARVASPRAARRG
jgi:Mrp family chromosome partitioning ATPase